MICKLVLDDDCGMSRVENDLVRVACCDGKLCLTMGLVQGIACCVTSKYKGLCQ